MNTRNWPALLLSAALASCVYAEAPAATPFDATLTGDWSGARSQWSAAGAHVELGFKADIFRNRGALQDGGQTMWQLDARIGGDLEKAFGWTGWSVYAQAINDRGGRTNGRHVGSLMGASNLEVDPAASRLLHLWVQKEAFNGQLSSLVGLYPIDSEFQVIDAAGMFSHPAYGPTADMSLTRGPSIFPIAAIGARVRAQTENGAGYIQAALLDGAPGHPYQRKGTHIGFHHGDGSFGIAELGLRSVAGTNAEAAIPVSKVAFGAWRYTTRVPDLTEVDDSGDPVKRLSHGAYLLAERELGRIDDDPGRAVTGFARYSGTDGDSSPIRRALNVGLRINAPFASRPEDAFGIAYTRGSIGKKYQQAQMAGGTPATRFEDALEVGYRIQFNPWLVIQPLVQRIRNPGADESVPDSTIVGTRVELAL